MIRTPCTQQFAATHIRSRTFVPSRCTATVQPDTAGAQPRAPSQFPSSRPDQPFNAGARSRRGPQWNTGDAPVTGGAIGRQGTDEVRRTRRDSPFGRKQYPQFVFMDNEPESVQVPTTKLKAHLLKEPLQIAVVRSLGLMGYVAAMSTLMATRAAALAASPPLDLQVRFAYQDSLSVFGTPFLMFVKSVSEPLALPSREGEGATPLDKRFSVTDLTELKNFRKQLPRAVMALQPGQFLVIEATGTRNQYRCLKVIATAREAMSREGRSLFVVPEEVAPASTAPPAHAATAHSGHGSASGKDNTEGARSSATTEPTVHGPSVSSSAPTTTAATTAAMPTADAALASEALPQSTTSRGPVNVQRFYVGRSESRTEPYTGAPEVAAATAAAGTEVAAVPAGSAGEDQVLVSASELEMLRGALSSMMEQQKLLTRLLEQQKTAQAATATS